MKHFSPLRLVEMIAFPKEQDGVPADLENIYSTSISPLPINFAALNLTNLICEEVDNNYKLVCLSGILEHLD